MQDLDGFFDEPIEEQPLPNFKVWAIYPFFVCETGVTVPYVEGVIKKDEDAVSITLWGWLEYPDTLKEYGYIVLCVYHPLSGRIYYQEVAPLAFAQWDTLRLLFYVSLQQPNANTLNEMQEHFVRAVREAFFAHPTTLLEDWAKNLRAMQKMGRGKQPADPEERLLLRLRGWATPKRSRRK